jgi:putative DNA primase/helicase
VNPLLAALGARRQFVVYKLVPLPDGRTDKVPVDPAAGRNSDAQNPATWLTPVVAQAGALALGAGHGVGIVIFEGCGLFCIDIDNGIDADGSLSVLAAKLVSDYAGCYVERSQSGKGLHIIASYVGEPPAHSTKNTDLHIELYTRRRFIALTQGEGDPLKDATNSLWATAFTYFRPKVGKETPVEWTTTDDPACTVRGTVDERIAQALKMRSIGAKLGNGKATFADLWNANADVLAATWPGNGGKDYDASSADQSLFNTLAFVFGNNCDTMQRVALEHPDCKLRREKWEREDYLRSTILKAVALPKRWRVTARRTAPGLPAAVAPAPALTETPHPPPVPLAPPPPSAMPAAVPESFFSCTDQANAKRLQDRYGAQLISVAGDFYSWDGRRWASNEGKPRDFACHLSQMVLAERNEIKRELDVLQAQATEGLGDAILKAQTEIEMLGKWASKCENVATQNSALAILRDLLDVKIESLDANPWLLNCINGTINLKTGHLMPHDSGQLITKLAPIAYDPAAKCPRFKKFLAEIFVGDLDLVDFMQRWYGYAVTGDVREQKILIKHGPGGNGKGTLTIAVNNVLGEYSTAATFGLLTGKDNSGSTSQLAEIAALRGRRLVSASESDDGAKLKEAQLKQLTGGDTLTGKRLYGQLFAFRPTHKLELLTNHKPVIKGADFSIWRRIMLLSFPVKFGSALEVERGDAMVIKDLTLDGTLLEEAPGILAWIVAGTALWLSQGLSPPAAILNASAEYRESQDHVGEFLAEMCTVTPGARQPLPSLYKAYCAWCREAGRDYPMIRQRLVDELDRRVPQFVRPDRTKRTAEGTYVMGIKLNPVG